MKHLYEKVTAYLEILKQHRHHSLGRICEIGYFPCEAKKAGDPLPLEDRFLPFDPTCDTWGEQPDSHGWFRFCVELPTKVDPQLLFVRLTTDHTKGWNVDNPQFIVYVDGKLQQGLDVNHSDILFESAGRHEVLLYAYTGAKAKQVSLGLELRELCREVEQLWYDIKIPYDALKSLDAESRSYRLILCKLSEALDLLKLYSVPSEEFYLSVAEACRFMREEFYEKCCLASSDGAPTVVGIGHTHIDCAWLWTLAQTREKVQRSFSTVLELMKRYPEYRFMSSQPLLYSYLKEEAPELYSQVKKRVAEGRWECEGAMWVEADCNLTSGESLVRQVLYGKRFFRQEFGVESRILWLPDVFGYSAALPQILRKSGVDWFVTSKISWNDDNKMPYDSFLWRGIDGTSVYTYFLTAQDYKAVPQNKTTYNAKINPAQLLGTECRYQQKELSDETMITFGFGDGGGGPTAEHLETGRRLTNGLPGIPNFRQAPAGDFLRRLEERVKNNPRLPVWQGELYLEFHRGTYTTQHDTKKNNRRSETLYLGTEWLCALDHLLTGSAFPKAALHSGWERILTNQFHDILPGSSIREVYEQCDRDYRTVREIAQPLQQSAAERISASLDRSHGYVVFNPNPTGGFARVLKDGKSVYVRDIPPKGYACVADFYEENHLRIGLEVCENEFYRLSFDEHMMLTSIYDKRNGREVLKKGELGNQLRVYADYPDRYDAWEWREYSLGQYRLIDTVESAETVMDGARGGVRIVRRYLNSTVTQTVWLSEYSERIDFETELDWQDPHHMVKAVFPTDLNASRATYEIQYGSIERPTHKNTSWDRSKFEVCAHRFADLSEGGYGVTLLNDCKYGHDIHDGVMMLSLLRSPTHPDPIADRGRSTCTYSILPHSGGADLPRVYAEAYELNSPLILCRATGDCDRVPASFAVVSADRSSVLCEVVKEAEDSEDLILRLFECSNTKTDCTLTFGAEVEAVTLCDFMERPLERLPVENNSVTLTFGAFEIHTVQVTPKR